MSERVFIGLGSNLDDPLRQLETAILSLKALPDIELKKVSSTYLTKPMGPKDQSNYHNAVAEIATQLTPEKLLSALQSIENQQGRKRDGRRWHERLIDLDILLYGEERVNSDNLVIPHPGMHERGFVLYPLHELDNNINIPGKGNINILMKNKLFGEVQQKLDSVL